MQCSEIGFGTYDCAYNIMLPYLVRDPTEPNKAPLPKVVAIDKCLLPEILKLWEHGIKTTGCCCGHGNKSLAFIGVAPEYIEKMKQLGYAVQFNSCRPDDEDSFVPKTVLIYGNANKGFNWWDRKENSDGEADVSCK